MSLFDDLKWALRRWFWNRIAAKKYSKTVPRPVDRVGATQVGLRATPAREIGLYRALSLRTVAVADRVPADEAQGSNERMMSLLAGLARTRLSPMQAGRPSIPADGAEALTAAYAPAHRRAVTRRAETAGRHPKTLLRPPVLPSELTPPPDLATLAVQGPYAGYLERDPTHEGRYRWDLSALMHYAWDPALHPPCAIVTFEVTPTTGKLVVIGIAHGDATVTPADSSWPRAVRIALCAATVHTALVRHWTWVHMVGGEYLALAVRNHLPADHPLCRFLWPHVVGTHASNRLAALGQLVPGGDFEALYGLPSDEVCRVVDDGVKTFDLVAFDPMADAARRGVASAPFAMPTLKNCASLYDLFHRHATRYLAACYAGDAGPAADAPVSNWYGALLDLFNVKSHHRPSLTRPVLATLLARLLYMVTVYHEQVGSQLWNYQLWSHVHPIRVYRDGRRMPEDIYQRLVNANFILNVERAPLIQDFSRLAEGVTPAEVRPTLRNAFAAFREDLERVQAEMERMAATPAGMRDRLPQPWAPWKIYPSDLKANINA
ncbi:MAG: hypothetical protein U0172_14220 [Nitrospiraceae bacterium]